eukprot:COSAG02_NODE_254_length_26937_cov_16.503950_19_plen_68_part_00
MLRSAMAGQRLQSPTLRLKIRTVTSRMQRRAAATMAHDRRLAVAPKYLVVSTGVLGRPLLCPAMSLH